MPAKSRTTAAKRSNQAAEPALSNDEVETVLLSLRRRATKRTLEGMDRYAIPKTNAFGVSVGDIRLLAKRLGRNHELAEALWQTRYYEARMLASFIDDPTRVTPAQMDRWCRDFDNWAICDTACFHLFDRTPHAFQKVAQWSRGREEFVRRAAFALLASLAVHDRRAEDAAFVRCLPLVERAASDERNFVKKGVLWALRAIGVRNAELNVAATAVAERLSVSSEPAARWVGGGVLRELAKPAALRRLAAKRRAARK
jgi:3-methyladenine DNA glycosylase AlkD